MDQEHDGVFLHHHETTGNTRSSMEDQEQGLVLAPQEQLRGKGQVAGVERTMMRKSEAEEKEDPGAEQGDDQVPEECDKAAQEEGEEESKVSMNVKKGEGSEPLEDPTPSVPISSKSLAIFISTQVSSITKGATLVSL